MSTGAIVVIGLAARVVLALVAVLARKGRERRLETRRVEAGEIRREAELHGARADGIRAEAEERAARARREEAVAREQALRADEHAQEADEHHRRAAELDPDGAPEDREPEEGESVREAR